MRTRKIVFGVLIFVLPILNAVYYLIVEWFLLFRLGFPNLQLLVEPLDYGIIHLIFFLLITGFVVWSVRREFTHPIRVLVLSFFWFIGNAILLPNFTVASTLYAMLQAHVSLFKTAKNITTYKKENGDLPEWSTTDTQFRINTGIPSFVSGKAIQNTRDRFADYKTDPLGYMVVQEAEAEGWILFSTGPDGSHKLTTSTILQIYSPRHAQPSPGLIETGYDPSNGSISMGEVWRTSQGWTSTIP